MKPILRLLSGAAVAVALIGSTITNANADDHRSGHGDGRGFDNRFAHRGDRPDYRGGWGRDDHRSHWNLGFSFVYTAPPVYYSPPPVVYYSPPPPPVAYSTPVQPPPPPVEAFRPLGVADVKALAKSGLSDEVIISQIRSSRVVYHLTTAEIIDLTENGVSQRVIDFMINTAGS